ncbi:aldo/keto reductase [Enterococcus spodopteracolus]|uniref:aldo/keto reductase n=1 Tax=Enterococcus spodopteracolus TaxID=3034501 RepID=UPI00264936C8|nr:aldo/keto reductase [Enterococcus spodopteracolus]
MSEVKIGHSQVYAEAIGLGANAVGGHNLFSGLADETGKKVVRAALDNGLNLIDTAYIYGEGRSEQLIGEVLQEPAYDRSRMIIATKAAHLPDQPEKFDNSPEFLKKSVDEALERLQTDYIDIFYIHFPDEATPKNEAVAALHELKETGKIRAIGVSNFNLEQLKEANQEGYIDIVQDQFSLIHRTAEKELFPYLDANEIGFVPYFPLASGLLTGKYDLESPKHFSEDDPRKNKPNFQGERYERIITAVDQLKPLAEKYQATTAQLVLAWYIAHPRISFVIPGAKKPQQVADNAKALDIHLSLEDVQTIDQLFREFK